jgi:hypothetical protein
MVKNSEPEPEPFAIESGAWESALRPFSTEAHAAYDLARRLMEIKRFLKSKPPNVSMAVLALDEAAELIFPFTEFHEVAYDLYLTAIDGHPAKAQENLMESLGIRY